METRGAIGELAAPALVPRRMVWRSALWLPVMAVAVGYYFGAWLGFAWRFEASGISFFWPPTAVLTAALLLNPPRTWGWLLAGALGAHAVAHAQNGVPVTAWPVQFLANATQSVLSAWLVRRFSDPIRPFADLHRALGFMACACVIGPTVASLIPLHVYVSLGWSTDMLNAWRLRTVSNAIAALILVPAIVMVWPWLRSKPRGIPALRVAEFVLALCRPRRGSRGRGIRRREERPHACAGSLCTGALSPVGDRPFRRRRAVPGAALHDTPHHPGRPAGTRGSPA